MSSDDSYNAILALQNGYKRKNQVTGCANLVKGSSLAQYTVQSSGSWTFTALRGTTNAQPLVLTGSPYLIFPNGQMIAVSGTLTATIASGFIVDGTNFTVTGTLSTVDDTVSLMGQTITVVSGNGTLSGGSGAQSAFTLIVSGAAYSDSSATFSGHLYADAVGTNGNLQVGGNISTSGTLSITGNMISSLNVKPLTAANASIKLVDNGIAKYFELNTDVSIYGNSTYNFPIVIIKNTKSSSIVISVDSNSNNNVTVGQGSTVTFLKTSQVTFVQLY